LSERYIVIQNTQLQNQCSSAAPDTTTEVNTVQVLFRLSNSVAYF